MTTAILEPETASKPSTMKKSKKTKKTKTKNIPPTVQMVMSNREIYLLQQLTEKLGVTKTAVITEAIKRVIEKHEHIL